MKSKGPRSSIRHLGDYMTIKSSCLDPGIETKDMDEIIREIAIDGIQLIVNTSNHI